MLYPAFSGARATGCRGNGSQGGISGPMGLGSSYPGVCEDMTRRKLSVPVTSLDKQVRSLPSKAFYP
ncbi:hypothetical protein MPNT_110027 [Candidatus Methylacidithermus pantelleriae]|uniref:Uncharacterized protein n=1 Tax=Candidatus Methylacidithermus pantelleriae TaxID=2744239 RepID=A0A8J2BQY6_9BACT|nr:hypothetical protein MPNT_110027 [Candidatus Methylacidithermus pantelleriae]